MIPVYQTRDGVGGNCLQAAVASVLELPLDDVPDFVNAPDGMRTWPLALEAWLTERGLLGMPVAPHGDLGTALAHMAEFYPDEPYVLAGREGVDGGHAVVGHGGAIVHDPSPCKPGLSGPVPQCGRYIALIIRPMPSPVVPGPVDLEPLGRHKKIGLAFSGGKDSLAVWHLLVPYHSRLVVYHADTGDRLPEAERIVQQFRARTLTPWVTLHNDSRRWREEHGLPSDLVPIGCTPAGIGLFNGEGGTRPLVSRFDCCFANRTAAMASRMEADGVTLIIDGTRRAEGGFGSLLRSSAPGPHPNSRLIGDGRWERFMPIADWSGGDVHAYLRSVGAPIAGYYEGDENYSAPVECASCPSSWSPRWLRWLGKNHPDIAAVVAEDQRAIREEIVRPLVKLRDSMKALDGV